jgi:NADPH:quinone reductase-like Zn-dependent oxidoreductase
MDVIVDTVGGATLRRSWGMLGPGGRMITVAADGATDERVRRSFFIVGPNREPLTRIGDLLEARDLVGRSTTK